MIAGRLCGLSLTDCVEEEGCNQEGEGDLCRLSLNSNKESRQIKETLCVIFDNRQEGDILMDVP